jgi:YbgC/YbaW family acyl-CoA thioester hydrolase
MPFVYQRKVYGLECDIYGHMNNSNYLKLLEEARSDALEETEYSILDLMERNIGIFVIRIEIDFKKGLTLGDTVKVVSYVRETTKVRGFWEQEIFNGKGELCTSVKLYAVFVKNGVPARLPLDIYEEYKKYID